MTFGGDNRVPIAIGKSHKLLRLETIYRYLPRFFELLHYRPAGFHLGELFDADRITCKASRYLFDYLEEIDQGRHRSTALSDRLNNPWDSSRHGPNESRNLFMALGRILHIDGLGCNRKLQSIMTTYVISHCADIVHAQIDGWIDYLNALDGIGTDPSEIEIVLSYVKREHEKIYGPFPDHSGDWRLSGTLLKLLVELLSDEDERHVRARQQCERCHKRRVLGHGDRRMAHIPRFPCGHRFYGPKCMHCARRNQFDFNRNYDHDHLGVDPRRPLLPLEEEVDNFSDLDSVLGGMLQRRR